jgi:hypothetical protein
MLAVATTGTAATAREKMVDNLIFEASGPPGWSIEIGDDIGLRLGYHFYGEPIAFTERRFPLTNVRESKGVRRWRSATGDWTIVIVATRGPCSTPGGALYTHAVRLTLNWGEPQFRNLSGCGGRVISRPEPQ